MAGPPGANAGRSYIAAGMFLFATLGFIVVQIDRQRKQRTQQVTGSRTEYLRYLGNVRTVARDAADQQRRALTWHHPDPAALPALAEDRTRLWEHTSGDDNFLHVRYGVCPQPLSLELVPPESAPIDQVDPAAASALHRLLVVHRLQPDLPAGIDLRAFDRIEVCGEEEPARSLARSMICSAAAFHAPEHLVVAVLTTERNLTHWDWLKWLPHALSGQQSDAVGPRRMVTTSLDDLATMLPPDLSDRPRFGADERPATPHILLVIDGASCRPATTSCPPTACTASPCSTSRPAGTSSTTPPGCGWSSTGDRPAGGRVPVLALRLREDPSGRWATSATWPRPRPSPAGSPRCTPSRPGDRPSGEITGRPTSWTCSASATSTPSSPTPPGGPGRRATGCGCRSGSARAAPWSTSTSRRPPSRAWARTAW